MADISRIFRIVVSFIASFIILFNPILMLMPLDKPLNYILSIILMFMIIVFMFIYSIGIMNLIEDKNKKTMIIISLIGILTLLLGYELISSGLTLLGNLLEVIGAFLIIPIIVIKAIDILIK